MKKIKKINPVAAELFEKGMYEKAIKKWDEVIKIDRENYEALTGIEKAKEKIEEEKKVEEVEFHWIGKPTDENEMGSGDEEKQMIEMESIPHISENTEKKDDTEKK